MDYYSFRTSFFNLDYNSDGMVTLNEAKLGILSLLDEEYLDKQDIDEDGEFSNEIYAQYHTYQPKKYNCVPSLISMDFVDCLIMSVRHSTTTTEDVILDFDHVLKLYFGSCDDISPLDDATCSMLVKEGGDLCNADPQQYCQISCFKCDNGGRMLFQLNDSDDNDNDEEHEDVDEELKHKAISSLRMYSRSEITALTGDHNQRIIDRKLGQHSDIKSELKADISNKGRIGHGHVCPLKAKMKHINRNRFVFMADIHVEPWYNPDGTSYITRFDDYSTENMFQCRDSSGNHLDPQRECTLTGFSDPPITLFTSALHAWNMYARRPEESVLFFIGDAQAHSYLNNDEAIESLMYSLIDSMLYYFEPDAIFICPGNNDGPHNSVFTKNGDIQLTEAWMTPLINTGIVNNIQMPHRKYLIYGTYYDTVSLFKLTGYYMKPLSKIHDNYFVIVVNTNLGSLNPTQQMALEHDLEFVTGLDNGKVAILGHHPSVLENMIPTKYLDSPEQPAEETNDIILGLFSGHIHYFSPTNKRGFTTLPAMTQYAPYSAFAMGDIQDFVMNDGIGRQQKRIKLTNEHLLMYIASDHQLVDSHCWQ